MSALKRIMRKHGLRPITSTERKMFAPFLRNFCFKVCNNSRAESARLASQIIDGFYAGS
jgi:hypothetical protein